MYTPVLVEFVPAVRLAGEPPQPPETLWLEIYAPAVGLAGYQHTLPRRWRVPVPVNGYVQLELIPTTLFLRQHPYVAKLYRGNNTHADLTQYWRVPAFEKWQSYDVVRGNGPDPVPPYVFSGLDIPGYEGWGYQNNAIVWSGGPNQPSPGSAYTVRYRQPLALTDIIVQE